MLKYVTISSACKKQFIHILKIKLIQLLITLNGKLIYRFVKGSSFHIPCKLKALKFTNLVTNFV